MAGNNLGDLAKGEDRKHFDIGKHDVGNDDFDAGPFFCHRCDVACMWQFGVGEEYVFWGTAVENVLHFRHNRVVMEMGAAIDQDRFVII